MGNCKYCGKPAGFLRAKHPECEAEHFKRESIIQSGRQSIIDAVLHSIKSSDNFDSLDNAVSQIEQSSFLPSSERKVHLINGWEKAVDNFLEDGILDVKEETRLVQFKEHFNLSQSELDKNGALTRITKAAVLRDVLDGKIPQRMSLHGSLPINFQKGEQLIWAFTQSSYLEDKTRRQYVGGSQGASIRIMKGVYYRVGAFKAKPVDTTVRVHVDTGWVAITNKNLYFAGSAKSLRIPFTKIVSFEPFNDGIGVMRDAATAKPQIFVTGDGWFTYNLVTNLAQI